jgi:hypothetical protein
MFMTMLGMAAVYALGAGIAALLGAAFEYDKNHRKVK